MNDYRTENLALLFLLLFHKYVVVTQNITSWTSCFISTFLMDYDYICFQSHELKREQYRKHRGLNFNEFKGQSQIFLKYLENDREGDKLDNFWETKSQSFHLDPNGYS